MTDRTDAVSCVGTDVACVGADCVVRARNRDISRPAKEIKGGSSDRERLRCSDDGLETSSTMDIHLRLGHRPPRIHGTVISDGYMHSMHICDMHRREAHVSAICPSTQGTQP